MPDAVALLDRHRATLRAVGKAVVPELAGADESAWHDIELTIEHALAARSERIRRQLALLLHVIGQLGRLRFGRALDGVDQPDVERFLLMLQGAPLPLLRRGIWGIRTLILMGHYTRPSVMHAIGYRADARGWSARNDEPR